MAVGSSIDYRDEATSSVTKREREVIKITRSHVKTKSKLTNLMNISRNEGYNGKYESNPHGIREILDNLFEFDQIGQRSGDINWGKWYFMKEDLKMNPHNKKLMNLTLISRKN